MKAFFTLTAVGVAVFGIGRIVRCSNTVANLPEALCDALIGLIYFYAAIFLMALVANSQ